MKIGQYYPQLFRLVTKPQSEQLGPCFLKKKNLNFYLFNNDLISFRQIWKLINVNVKQIPFMF